MSLTVPPNTPDTQWPMFTRCCSGLVFLHGGWYKKYTIAHWEPTDWSFTVLMTLRVWKVEKFRCSGMETLVDWFWFGGHLSGLGLSDAYPSWLNHPYFFFYSCVTRRKKCKHVRLLFSANSPRSWCQTRLCLKTSLAPTTTEGDRVTFLVNQQLDFHFGTLWVLLLSLFFWTEGQAYFHSWVSGLM